ncbi:MAG TPA: hypothetical protein PKY87_05775 [Terricaulis sp.]|nr:hypothetical protein [Terricaulis sp.]
MILAIATIIFLGTTWLLLQPVLSKQVFELGETPWLGLLGRYSAIITTPVAIAGAISVFGYFRKKGRTPIVLYYVAGVAVGVIAGLLMVPLTGGFSLISAPPVSTSTMMIAWLIRRPDRDAAANPPTSAP